VRVARKREYVHTAKSTVTSENDTQLEYSSAYTAAAGDMGWSNTPPNKHQQTLNETQNKQTLPTHTNANTNTDHVA